jgi:hypothetical protein
VHIEKHYFYTFTFYAFLHNWESTKLGVSLHHIMVHKYMYHYYIIMYYVDDAEYIQYMAASGYHPVPIMHDP